MDELITELWNGFFEFLPRLIGATLIVLIGATILLLGPVLLYRMWRRGAATRSRASNVAVGTIFWTWVAMASLVLASLAVNTLGIDWMQNGMDSLIAATPILFVAAIMIGLGTAISLLFIGDRPSVESAGDA